MSQYFNLPDSPGGGPAAGRARRGPRRSGPAAASLLLGIVGALTHFCLIGYALGAVALVLGIVALVQIGRSNGGQYGKGFAVGGVILSVLVLGYGAHDLLVVSKAGDMSKASNPEFEQAEDNISRKRGDRVAFGNTPAAEAMAGRFSAKFKKLRQSLFTTRGSSGGISLTEGEFLTHCELRDGRCAFLVHVPALRKFDDEAKRALCDLAWMLAWAELEASGEEAAQKKLAVGVKGAVLYERIMTGVFRPLGEGESPTDVIRNSNQSESLLYPYFSNRQKDSEAPSSAAEGEEPAAATEPDLSPESKPNQSSPQPNKP